MDCVNKSIEECPILIFLLFQKAIRSELDRLNSEAIAFATGGRGDLKSISKRFRFLLDIYKHHCDAEDEVIFPALDIHVKNVAWTYSLEHKGERALISQLFELLNSGVQNDNKFRRDLASCAGAIHTSIIQHICKEEKQIYPLLIEKFTFEEQVDLVWHFICSIPVNMMEEFLPWLSSCISPYEHHDIVKCMCKIAPEQNLLPQVISSWMEGRSTEYRSCSNDGSDFQDCLSSGPEKNIVDQTEKKIWACHHSKTGKRKHLESNCDAVGLSEMHPINGILHWHNAIKRELNDILEVARKMQDCSEVSDLSTFHSRLQFIGDICNFHSIAEDQVIVPAVDREISFVQEHSEEESQFTNFKNLIKKIWCTEAPVSSTEIHSALILHADQLKESIQRHFQNEEAEVLPLVRFRLCPEKQRELLYKSIWVMPLKLLERAIPWFVATLTEEEAKSFLQNIQMAASTSDAALITLLCSWACKGQPQETSSADIFICLPSNVINRCPLEEKNGTLDESSYLQTKKYNRPFEKCTLSKSYADDNNSESTNITNLHKLSYDKQSCLYSPKSSHSISDNSSALSLKSSLILKETKIISLNGENTVRPIDSIFIFHKAILKDLEYLDVESGKFLGSDEVSLRQFSGRFCLLWGLYKAHSNSEDDIIFPALESKAALHNVSHSYILDHKQEENLFTDISTVLEENSQLQATNLNELQCDWEMKHNELATKLQALCKSLRITLEQHIFKEELELWPLFNKHFSVEEQNKIMGRIIGRTGAEVLQSMLPWVTSALSLEEKKCMMDTWKQATKNTMFNEWLNEWWNGTTTSFSHAITHTNLVDNTATGDQDDHNQNDQMFKAGWKYIFRMNQIELESELQKASFNSTLDPRREAYLIQNLLTSRWIAAQQKSPLELTKEQEDSRETPGCSSSFRDRDKKIFGCEHYKRNCKLLATCCNKMFTCRFCHDKASDHSMDRKATTQMLCMRCLKVQPVGQTCRTPSCDGLSMAKYFCHICKLFDDERAIYHCPFCNLCRIGKGLGIDFFHCMGCNFCMGMKLLDHKCPGKTLERNCPICCDYLFTTTERFRALRCGHLMHTTCFQAYTCSHYTCPICSKSLGDMTVYFGMLDALLAAEELPEEYRDRYQDIICNDCDKKGKSRFLWLYHKCGFCGSYNTMVIKNEASEGIMFFLV